MYAAPTCPITLSSGTSLAGSGCCPAGAGAAISADNVGGWSAAPAAGGGVPGVALGGAPAAPNAPQSVVNEGWFTRSSPPSDHWRGAKCGMGALAVRVLRTARSTAEKAASAYRKRTSALAGWTLTSTSSGGRLSSTTAIG